jgi:hypothetical protein
MSAFLIFSLTFTTQAQVANTAPTTLWLRRGQVLELSLLTPLDSSQTLVGDEVRLKLVRPLFAEGVVVLPAESIVQGRVTNVKQAGKNCKAGKIAWELGLVRTPGGEQIRLHLVDYDTVFRRGVLVDQIPPESSAKKIGNGVKIGLVSPLFVLVLILSSPVIVGMWYENRCAGHAGYEKQISAGEPYYAVVSRDIKIHVLPAAH